MKKIKPTSYRYPVVRLCIFTTFFLINFSLSAQIEKITSIIRGKNQIIIVGQYLGSEKTENIVISFPQKDIIRINKSVNSMPVVNGDAISFKLADGKEVLTINTGEIRVDINKTQWDIKVFNKENKVIWHEINKEDYDANGENITALETTCEARPDEHFYGFGEKFNDIDQRGKMAPMHISDAYMTDSSDNYKSIPFFISTKKYGVFVNSAMELIFHMGDLDSTQYSFIIPDTEVEYFIYCNSDPLKIIEQYTELTGRTKLIPKWSLEPWLSRRPMVGWNDDISWPEQDVDMIIDNGYRLGVILWEGIRSYFDHSEGNAKYDLINKWHNMGLKVVCWSLSGHLTRYAKAMERFEIEKSKAFFVRNHDGNIFENPLDGWTNEDLDKTNSPPQIFIDATNPDALEWYCETMYGRWMRDKDGKSAPDHYNFDGVKIDFCESFPIESEHLLMKNYQKGMRNLHPVLFSEYVYDWLQVVKPEGGITWIRGGGLGLQKTGYVWGGDRRRTFKQYQGSVEGLLSLSISGVPLCGTDIGGYRGGDNPHAVEAYIRAVQFATFSPSFHDHGSAQAPWELDEYGRENYKFYSRLRYNLIPYLYHYLKRATETGEPLMRTLYLHYPDDKNTYTIEDEYLLGENILVAPIISPANQRDIYLPEGQWIDFWTGDYYEGKQTIAYNTELNMIPVFYKNASITPLGMHTDLQYGSLFPNEKKNDLLLTFNITGDKNTKQSFYDGEKDIQLSVEIVNNTLVFNVDKISKDFGLRVLASAPQSILVNSKTLPEVKPEDFNKSSNGWMYDTRNKFILIKIKHQATNKYQLKITTEKLFKDHVIIRKLPCESAIEKETVLSSYISRSPVYTLDKPYVIMDCKHYLAREKLNEDTMHYMYAVSSSEEREYSLWVKMCKNKPHHRYARWYKMNKITIGKGDDLLSIYAEYDNVDMEKIFLALGDERPFLKDEKISDYKMVSDLKKYVGMISGEK